MKVGTTARNMKKDDLEKKNESNISSSNRNRDHKISIY